MEEKKSANQLASILEGWFKKLPPLPTNAVDSIFKIAPILVLVFGILGVILSIGGILSQLALAPFAVAWMGGAQNFGLGIISTIGWLVSSVMMLLAYPGLKAGKMSGWNMLFWSEMVNVVTAVIGFWIGNVVGAAIAFYLLFQLKPKYK